MLKITAKEAVFQLVLHICVLVFFAFDKRDPSIHAWEVAFFLNYALAAFCINFIVLPKFYRDRKVIPFLLFAFLAVAVAVLIEELVLEAVFFPGDRAQSIQAFYAALSIIPIVAILSGFKFAWDALQLQGELASTREHALALELQFLKTQINPHFLFNNLNNLYAYSLEGSEKTPEIILELSGLLRYMLYDCQSQDVPLQKELEQLANFINLNELQIEDRGTVSFSTIGSTDQYRIAPLILIVFVENSFKHSLSSQSDNIDIEVAAEITDDGWLHFRCRNTFRPNSNTDRLTKGIGLANVKKRLELIYPEQHELVCSSADNIYTVDLSIQLNEGVV